MLLLSEDVIDDIIYCARIGDRQELEEIIDSVSKQRACRKSDVLSAAVESTTGNTALHHAAANGHLGLVEYICAVGTDGSVRSIAEAQNRSGNTAFHWAAVNGHLDVVKALVSAGAQTSKLNKAGRDAVLEAEAADKLDVVTWLLENGDELPELPDRRGVEHTTVDDDDDDDDSTEQASELQLAKE